MKKTLAMAALIFSAYTAGAWGQTGHRVVGFVAAEHISKKTAKAVAELLDGESLAIVSTWMDEIRSDSTYDFTHDWHWVSIADGGSYAESEKNPRGDLVEAIDRMKNILKSDTAQREMKVKALKYLVHLVGDLHQPLHVGNGTDRGGNDVKVKWFGENSNLHRVWDSDIIDAKQLSYTELACSLMRTEKRDQTVRWRMGNTVEWAEEAMQYRPAIYDIDNKDRLGYEYMYQHWDLVQQQLHKAGVRLAAVLDECLG